MSFNLSEWVKPELMSDEQYCRNQVDWPNLTTDYQPNNPQWVANRKRIMAPYEAQYQKCLENRKGFQQPSITNKSLPSIKKAIPQTNSFVHPLLKYNLLK